MRVTAAVTASDTQTPRLSATRSLGAPPMPTVPVTSRELAIDVRDRASVRVEHPDVVSADRDLGRTLAYGDRLDDAIRGRIDDGNRVRLRDDGRRSSPRVRATVTAAADHRECDQRPRTGGVFVCRPRLGAARFRGHHKRGVLGEDPLLELAEVCPGLEAQLVRERRSCVPVDGERIRLTARAIEREHELTSDAFAVRMPADELLELSDELRMAAECEIGVDPVLGRREAELLETGDLVLRERLVGHVRERRPSPERESISQRRRRVRRRLFARVRHQLFEPVEIDVLGRDVEHVSRRLRRDDAVAEHLAQPRHVHLQRLRRRRGSSSVPELVDQHVSGDDFPRTQHEQREERSLLSLADRQRLAVLATSIGPKILNST